MSSVIPTYEAELTALLSVAEKRQSDGPAWLQNLRAKALVSFREQGLPTPKNEEWKYTPLRPVAAVGWKAGEPGPAVFDTDFGSLSGSPIRVVTVNGRFDRNLSEVPTVKGLVLGSLRDALTEHGEVLEGYLGQAACFEQHPFAALGTALFEDGVFLHLKRGASVEQTIEVLHITTGDGAVYAPRVLIVAEENSTAKIVERYVTDGEAKSLTIPVTEVYAAPYSNIEHVRVQDEAVTNFHFGLWVVRQERDSEYRSYNVAFGAAIGRTDQNIWIGGEHCVTRLDGVVVARGEQLLDNHTRLDHAVPNCNSFEIYKQIIDDSATIVFNGKIFVHQDAQKTDAEQTNQALLLSPQATINSKPQLEIFADDVKCTHGATVGQLEEAPRFYMMSRGIPREQTEAILVYAFAAEVLELITDDAVKDNLEKRLFEKLGI